MAATPALHHAGSIRVVQAGRRQWSVKGCWVSLSGRHPMNFGCARSSRSHLHRLASHRARAFWWSPCPARSAIPTRCAQRNLRARSLVPRRRIHGRHVAWNPRRLLSSEAPRPSGLQPHSGSTTLVPYTGLTTHCSRLRPRPAVVNRYLASWPQRLSVSVRRRGEQWYRI